MSIIEDGTGAGYKQKVNANNRSYVNAVTESEEVEGVHRGDAYNINTGEISLTSTSPSAVLYIQNNETEDLVITAIAVGVSSGGTVNDSGRVQIIRNPTGGTLITDTTNVDQNQGRNFGSSKTLTINAYKGYTYPCTTKFSYFFASTLINCVCCKRTCGSYVKG